MRGVFSVTGIFGPAAMLTLTSGASAVGYSSDQDLGSPSPDNIYERVITISPNAKWVNVNRDETVKFIDVSSGKSFVGHFKTPLMKFDLTKVAPAGILAGRRIDAYVGISQRVGRHNN